MYQATREWRPGVYLITKEVAKQIVKDKCKKYVHNFIQGWAIVLWADWKIKQFNEFVDSEEVDRIAITIPSQMGHHMAIPTTKLYLFDVGYITKEEIEVIDAPDLIPTPQWE